MLQRLSEEREKEQKKAHASCYFSWFYRLKPQLQKVNTDLDKVIPFFYFFLLYANSALNK